MPLLVVVNKNDGERSDEDMEVLYELFQDDWLLLPVSATTGRNLERLKWAVFEQLEIIRASRSHTTKSVTKAGQHRQTATHVQDGQGF
jgi:predicted GTPase